MKVIDRQSIDGEVFYLVRLTATELKPMFGDEDIDPDGLQPQDVVCVDVRGLVKEAYNSGYNANVMDADRIVDDEVCRPRLATPWGPPGTTHRVVNCTAAQLNSPLASVVAGAPPDGTK